MDEISHRQNMAIRREADLSIDWSSLEPEEIEAEKEWRRRFDELMETKKMLNCRLAQVVWQHTRDTNNNVKWDEGAYSWSIAELKRAKF